MAMGPPGNRYHPEDGYVCLPNLCSLFRVVRDLEGESDTGHDVRLSRSLMPLDANSYSLSAIDIGIAIGIITIVVGQFTAKEADAWTVFRKEIKKALLATWLWLGSIITIFTNPSAIFAARYKTASSDPTEEQARKIARKIIIGWFVYVVLVL